MNHSGFVNFVTVCLCVWWGLEVQRPQIGTVAAPLNPPPLITQRVGVDHYVIWNPSFPWNTIGHCCANKAFFSSLLPIFLDASLQFIVTSASCLSVWRHVDKGTAEGAVDAMLLYGQGKQSCFVSIMCWLPLPVPWFLPSAGSGREWRRKEQECK